MSFFTKKRTSKAFVSKLPSYEPWSIIIRFVLVSIVGMISMQFIIQIVDFPLNTRPKTIDYIIVIVGFNLLSEVNIFLDNFYEKILPIPEKLKLRLMVHSVVGLILIVSFFFGMRAIFPHRQEYGKDVFFLSIAMGLLFVNGFSGRLILIRFMDKWVYAQKRIDEMKQEKLKMDYTVLQDQLNPHFLFNNLSVLKSLIIYDQSTAVKFTQDFTDIYRYVLKSKDHFLVQLSEEIRFIETYIALHKERLGDAIVVDFNIDKINLNMQIAPLSLQLLVENAIKHNIASKENPLCVEISTSPSHLLVRNNIQKKETYYSSGTGLQNLKKRYELLGTIGIEIQQNDSHFSVSIPLIEGYLIKS